MYQGLRERERDRIKLAEGAHRPEFYFYGGQGWEPKISWVKQPGSLSS